MNILQRRHHSANVLIFAAQVQGETAAAEVGAGIRYFNQKQSVDVIIVARGGGSAEDLAAFNHEALARTVAASAIPIISAIGHETDFTIIDFVADLRAPTPSAAAELVIRSLMDVEAQADGLHERLLRAMQYRLLIGKQALTELAQHGAFARTMDVIRQRQQKLDDLVHRLADAQRGVLERQRRRWETLASAVRHYDLRLVLAGVRKDLDARVSSIAAAARNQLLEHRVRLGANEHSAWSAFAARHTGAWLRVSVRRLREVIEGRKASGRRGRDFSAAGKGHDPRGSEVIWHGLAQFFIRFVDDHRWL